jgi:hypothetical protein
MQWQITLIAPISIKQLQYQRLNQKKIFSKPLNAQFAVSNHSFYMTKATVFKIPAQAIIKVTIGCIVLSANVVHLKLIRNLI